MAHRFRILLLLTALATAAFGLGACSGSATDTSALAPSLTLPSLPKLGSADNGTAPSAAPADTPAAAASTPPEAASGSATEIYSRIGQGAVGCWFGSKGPLKKDYIYHAEADAPSRGSKAEITIHVRDLTQPNPRGAKAYKVKIEPTGDASATVATENLKMPNAAAAAMTADVGRWAKGDTGCASTSTAAGWGNANVAAGDPPAAAGSAAKLKKTKGKAAAAKSAAKSAAQSAPKP